MAYLRGLMSTTQRKTGGSWPKWREKPPQMGCNGGSRRRSGMPTGCAMTCSSTFWRIWLIQKRSWWWMRQALSKKVPSPLAWQLNTAGRLAILPIVRSESCLPYANRYGTVLLDWKMLSIPSTNAYFEHKTERHVYPEESNRTDVQCRCCQKF